MSDERQARPVTEFLIDLNENESFLALQSAYSQKSVLLFKTEAAPKIINCTIDSFVDKKVILKLEDPSTPIAVGVEVSMKFSLGTEVYFVKAPIKKQGTLAYFDVSAKVIHLKRRKEPRYVIPKKWNQAAAIISASPGIKPVPCTVIDISASGLRLEVKESVHINCKRDDIIKVQFQIHRRAEVACDAIIRFFMNRNGAGTLLGLELIFMKEVQRERVVGVVEDINGFLTAVKI